MTTTTTRTLAVRRAERVLRDARSAHRALESAVVAGDDSVTALQISESAGAVRLAELRLEAARREAESAAADEVDEAQAARLRRRQRAQRRADQERRESWQRSIDSGEAARHLASFGSQRPNLPPEYEAMLVEQGLLEPRHPDPNGPSAA